MTIIKAYVDIPDGQIHYRHAPGNGQPIVFLHRTPSSSLSFEPMMRALAGDRPLYAFDTPGFGQSFTPPGMPSMADYGNWMKSAFDVLKIETCAIFGNHTGVHIAVEMALSSPHRVSALIFNGIAYYATEERLAFRARIRAPLAPDGEGAYARETWKMVASLLGEIDPLLIHQEFMGAMNSITGRHQAFAAVGDQDLPSALAKVRCPVLALTACDDMFRDKFDVLLSDIPTIAGHVLGAGGICSPERDAEANAQALRSFLSKLNQNEK